MALNKVLCTDFQPYRRLVSATLLLAISDARQGSLEASAWIQGDMACQWADCIGLATWPPSAQQISLADRRRLVLFARYEPDESGDAFFSFGTVRDRKRRTKKQLQTHEVLK